MKYIKCEDCPCFEGYYGECNLDYKIKYIKNNHMSPDCELISINYGQNGEYLPEEIEIEDKPVIANCGYCGSKVGIMLIGGRYCVMCRNCHARGPIDVSECVAIDTWNRRNK